MAVERNLWASLRATTIARVGLGRAGDAPPLGDLLTFQLAHARARDAVGTTLDVARLTAELQPLHVRQVSSLARDRIQYLRRPDLGRQLDRSWADDLSRGPFDAVFVVADGLSAKAVNDNAAAFISACMDRLASWRFAPIVLAQQARVAIGDEIGSRLEASLAVVLIGERPGLSVPHSMGVYITYNPQPGRTDAQRNCISNIHADGLNPEQAAQKAAWLMSEALARKLTGVDLKDAAPDAGGLGIEKGGES
ncbi:ethanolamine ammonia-lyase subunit EutC [Roseiarcaceae bacterium H3SJ34-1]|uniref:ethanolamine ammonia-lyase subunit EutC n=1 Tax=Terripilifer ovatus TaxID=3032367 RepID=UPI003AB972EA|nr:ethanolamine ammonia-lyase subunit EutC [Roseiarcaceae bacterium H3SJ34-1]